MPASLGECDLSSLQNERALADEHLVLIWRCKRKKIKIFKMRENMLDSDVKTQQQEKRRQWQMAMNRWDLATKKWEPKHHDVLCAKHFEKNVSQIAPCWAFSLGSNTCPQGNRRLGQKNSSSNQSKDEAPTRPLPVVGPLFISRPLVIPSFSVKPCCVAFRSFSLRLL